MSSQNQQSTTARASIKQFLSNNGGWHEVNPIATSIGYSHGHVLQTGTAMANDGNSPVERRKNGNKPVIGYRINGDTKVPASDRQKYIRLIRMYSNAPPSNLNSMSLDTLQTQLRNIADARIVLEHKVEFRIP